MLWFVMDEKSEPILIKDNANNAIYAVLEVIKADESGKSNGGEVTRVHESHESARSSINCSPEDLNERVSD